MPVNYSVSLLNPIGEQLDLLDDWLTLSYTRSVNDVGVLELVLDGNYSPFANLKLDGRLVVWRNAGGRSYADTDTVFLIRQIERTLSSSGQRTITVVGLSAVELLRRRIVAYDAGSSQASKSDLADDLLKEIVAENLGSSATDSNRDISTYLDIEADVSLGPTVTTDFARDNVLSVCQEISQSTIQAGSPVYFDVVAPTQSTLEFRTFRGQRGLDHTFPSGTNPVVLSPDRGNLVNVRRTYDWSDEVTFAYVGGQGLESDRDVQSASSGDRIANSPLNRRERFVSYSQATSGSAALVNQAEAALREGRPKRSFVGELVNVPGATEYGVHWKFGDLVTAQFEGESVDCMVEAVQVSFVRGRESINAKLRVVED